MSDDYIDRIERFLEQHGITAYCFARCRKHRIVIVVHGGRNVTVGFPTSSANWNGPHVVVTRLRHALGLVGRAGAR
jgi:hypothetical protein